MIPLVKKERRVKKHAMGDSGPKQGGIPSLGPRSEALSVDGNPSMMYLRMLLLASNRIKRRADKQSITDVQCVKKSGPLSRCQLTTKRQLAPSLLGTILLNASTAKRPTSKPSVKNVTSLNRTKKKRKTRTKNENKGALRKQ
jgi:hypothetical protein